MSLLNENEEELRKYIVINIIGTGSFGTCYKVQKKTNKKFYVWKAVDFGSMTLHEKELLVTEVNLMGTLKHPHIVQYFGRIVHKPSGTLYIIMEWCERGDLDTLIKKCKSKKSMINEKFIWKVLYQTAKALETCHSLLKQVTVLHRDIKPANIFLDKNYNVKLGDFGLAKILQSNISFSSTLVGTPYYMSPEQIHGSKYNKKSDIWSLGCLVYEMCCLNQPFKGSDLIQLKNNIIKNRIFRIPSTYSDYLDKIVKLLLSFNHETRPSVEVIVHHPTVICNYDKNALPFQAPACGDTILQRNPIHETTFQIQDNIDNIIEKIEKSRHRRPSSELEPQTITENVYNQKLVNRLKLLREKESILKAKEDSLKTKEFLLKTREHTLEEKSKQIEKREREIIALRKSENKSYKLRTSNKNEDPKSKIQVHLDSTTCSTDPGDTSIIPTTVKLDPAKIIRPAYFIRNDREFVTRSTEKLKDYKLTKIIPTRQKPLFYLQNELSNECKSNSVMKNYQNFVYKK